MLQDGTCTCTFADCIHLLAVRMAAGLTVETKRRRTNLSALRRKARAGRKQGRKRGLDAKELCAPDAVIARKVQVQNCCYCTT